MTNQTEDTAGAPPSAPPKDPPPVQGQRAIISARYLPLLGEFRAKADARYYLEGIYIEPHEADGAYLVATDGHRLCVIHDESAQVDAPMLLNPVQLIIQQAKGAWLADFNRTTCELQDELEQFVMSARAPLIEASYIDWRGAVPTVEGDHKPGALNQALIQAIAKAPWPSGRNRAAMFHFAGEDRPATIRMPDFPEILIVVAPQRHDGMQRTPGWFRKRPNSNIQQQPLELTGGDVDPPANDPPVADAGEATAPPPDDLAKPKRKRKGATP